MRQLLLSLALLVTASAAKAEQIDGGEVVRVGLSALSQNLAGAPRSVGLGGSEVLVGFGLWLKVYQEFAKGKTEGQTRDFVRDHERLIAKGLTLGQLVRLGYPNEKTELTTERLLTLALRPFGNQLNDVHSTLENWMRQTTWVNVDDGCGPVLAP